MSSLRRRAIWMQRARSTERSSIGGRASARTTAPGVAGVDEQPQPGEHVADLGALEERRGADQAVGQRALLERDGDAVALVRAPSARARAMRSGAHALADEALDLGGDGLGLRALVGAAPEARPSPPGARRGRSSALGDPAGDRARRRPAAARTTRSGQRRLRSSRDLGRRRAVGAPKRAQVLGRGAAEAADRLVVVGRRRPGSPCSAAEQLDEQRLGEVEVLEVVDEHVAPARRDARARRAARSRSSASARRHEVAGVERALLGEQPVVGGVEAGELALALGARALGVVAAGSASRPRGVVARR